MVIKKIFEGNFDKEVHNDLMKFSKGEFKNRYLIEAKRQAKGITLKASAEFVNTLVKLALVDSNNPLFMKGVIVSTLNLEGELDFPIKKKSNFQGVRKLEVETEIEPSKILELMEKYPKVFFALTFKTANLELKIKPKAPMSGKPGPKAEAPKPDFCVLKTNDEQRVKPLLFDVGEFKEVSISHTLKINEIVYPTDVVTLTPNQIREQAKRKGILVRNVTVDGKSTISEAKFVA